MKPLSTTLDLAFLVDRILATLIRGLFKNDFTLVARPLVRLIRSRRGDSQVQGESSASKKPKPVGPFKLADPDHACDMLIFVPRSVESYLIDDSTGGYGYSHVAVDFGEVDQATGKRVMVEATTGTVVHRSFLDTYNRRPFIRIPLGPTGVNCREFRDCVLDKLGEPYDYAEALTWGEVDDPAKQVCTDLAGDCLPTKMRREIVRQARDGKLGRRTVSIHGPARVPLHIFISPNGFARFFGAPKGHKIHQPDEPVEPRIRRAGFHFPRVLLGVVVGIGVAAALLIGWRLMRRNTSTPPASSS